jgi:hypothetical protein
VGDRPSHRPRGPDRDASLIRRSDFARLMRMSIEQATTS